MISAPLYDLLHKAIPGIISALVLAVIYWLQRRYGKRTWKFMYGVASLIENVEFIKAELLSNGGRSLKDLVKQNTRDLAIVEARQRGMISAIPRPIFETDCEFNWIDANLSMERMTGQGFSQLAKKRWVSLVHDEDRTAVQAEIAFAVRDRRPAAISFRLTTEDGVAFVRMDATPVFDRTIPETPICWTGTLTKQDDRRVDERRK